MFATILRKLTGYLMPSRRWAKRTLAVGPVEPVDGDSVSCTKALLNHLRALGNEAWTLPTITMYEQLSWILTESDIHPNSRDEGGKLTTDDLQQVYDKMLAVWQPDEIVLLDGPRNRLGFNPRGVRVFTIDHHMDNGARDDDEAYIQEAPSAGCLLIEYYRIYDPILAVSILTDTFWLRQNHPSKAIEALNALHTHGGLTDEVLSDIQRKLVVYKDPAIMSALHDADFRWQDKAVFVVLKQPSPEIHRGVMAELGYFFRHICVVRGDGYVSFRTTDVSISLRPLAQRWNGGGHDNKAAGHLEHTSPDVLDCLYQDFIRTVQSEA